MQPRILARPAMLAPIELAPIELAPIELAPVEQAPVGCVDRTVLACAALSPAVLGAVLRRYGVERVDVRSGAAIPGSFWGAPEAGLIANRLHLRPDTPAHSALHELAHFVCMSAARRRALHTDAGGDTDEECGVCYLQVLLAGEIDGFGIVRSLRDMDAWGYSFREGSADAWFRGDGRFARNWLRRRALIDDRGRPTWRLRC
jgi:hypothetical protein